MARKKRERFLASKVEFIFKISQRKANFTFQFSQVGFMLSKKCKSNYSRTSKSLRASVFFFEVRNSRFFSSKNVFLKCLLARSLLFSNLRLAMFSNEWLGVVLLSSSVWNPSVI